VFHAPVNYEAVPGVCLECLSTHIQMQCTLHHIHKLMMRMAMSRSHPALFKIMPYQHQLIAVSQYLSRHSAFGSETFCVLPFSQLQYSSSRSGLNRNSRLSLHD